MNSNVPIHIMCDDGKARTIKEYIDFSLAEKTVINYKSLLERYILLVGRNEGVTFIEDEINRNSFGVEFSDNEWKVLYETSKELGWPEDDS